MNYEELSNSKQFKDLLEQVPEGEREKVVEALKAMVQDFEKNILAPLESMTKR